MDGNEKGSSYQHEHHPAGQGGRLLDPSRQLLLVERVAFPSAEAGKMAYYALRWLSTRGETGPWREVAAATVAAQNPRDLVLFVARRQGVVARRDRVLADDPAVDALRGQFAATLVFQHFSRGLVRRRLRRVQT